MSDLFVSVWHMDGSTLKPNDDYRMYSPNGEYYLVFQNDGNLVLYEKGGVKRWASNDSTKYKYALNTATSLVLQADGNLVIYDKDGKALWASGTDSIGVPLRGPYKGKSLNLSNEGRLFIIAENIEDPDHVANCVISHDLNKREWPMDGSTLTPNDDYKMYSPNGEYYLVFQNDGNLVLYKEGGVKRWASHDSTKYKYALNTATSLVFQADGNMVIYGPVKDGARAVLWASGTDNIQSRGAVYKGKSLNLSNEGRLFIIAENKEDPDHVIDYVFSHRALLVNFNLNKLVWFMDGSEFTPNDHNKMYTPNGRFYLVFQNDGNLVLYEKGGVTRWASHDSTKYKYALNTADKLVFQTDGNMVIYDKDGKALWSSDTDCIRETHSGQASDGGGAAYNGIDLCEEWRGKYLVLTDEGEFVIIGENTEDPKKNIRCWGANGDKGCFDTGFTDWEQFGIGIAAGVAACVLFFVGSVGIRMLCSAGARVGARAGVARVVAAGEVEGVAVAAGDNAAIIGEEAIAEDIAASEDDIAYRILTAYQRAAEDGMLATMGPPGEFAFEIETETFLY